MSTITPEVSAAATTLDAFSWIFEEGFHCGTCGDQFDVGQQTLSVYAPHADIGKHRAVEDIHLRCYQGEEVRT